MEHRHQSLLERRLHVDQDVATRDQVHARERWIAEKVVLGEKTDFADIRTHDEGAVLALEKSFDPFLGHVCGYAPRIAPKPGGMQRVLIYVATEDLYVGDTIKLSRLFQDQNGEAVDLFPCGAARHPDPDFVILVLAFENRGKDLSSNRHERFAIAKKLGHADQQIAKQPRRLPGVILKVLDIFRKRRDAKHLHAPANAAVH